MPRICGVLALQGSFNLHSRLICETGAEVRQIRRPEDFASLTHLIVPGGESTTLYRLGSQYGLLEPVKEGVRVGLPVLGTCAGAILLGQGPPPPPRLQLAPVKVVRNAYGRQKESFSADLTIKGIEGTFRGIFIRAPKFSLPAVSRQETEILGFFGDQPVILRHKNVLLAAFHPELTGDSRIHRYFLSL